MAGSAGAGGRGWPKGVMALGGWLLRVEKAGGDEC